jgi:Hint domain
MAKNFWIGPQSGINFWDDAANWSQNLPDNDSRVAITASGTYTVLINADDPPVQIESLVLGNRSGIVSLADNGSLTVTDDARINHGVFDVGGTAVADIFGTLSLHHDATVMDEGVLNAGGGITGFDSNVDVDGGTAFAASLRGSNTYSLSLNGSLEVGTSVSSRTAFTFADNGANTLRLDEPGTSLDASITGFGGSNVIDIGTLPFSSDYTTSFSGTTLTIENGDTPVFTFRDINNPGALGLQDNGAGGTELICFAAGTRIATPSGEIPVEFLAVGGTVVTLSGEPRPITWIGKGTVLAPRDRRNAAIHVIVRRDALADGVPHCDLHVTKGHSFYLDDVLVPAEFLVNHRSIVWDDRAREVTIYHIELASHDVLLANGAPAESYRDDGNRWLFQNANTGWDQPPKPPYAPVLTGGPVVDAIWRRLLDRSGLRLNLPTTDDPDLHLLVDGLRVDGRAQPNGVYVFRVLKPPTSVRIISRAGAPDELGLARDPRRLGAALRRVILFYGQHIKVMEADDPSLCDGFHAFEADNGFRWTTGTGRLPAALFEGAYGACELQLDIACTTQYQLSECQARDAAMGPPYATEAA